MFDPEVRGSKGTLHIFESGFVVLDEKFNVLGSAPFPADRRAESYIEALRGEAPPSLLELLSRVKLSQLSVDNQLLAEGLRKRGFTLEALNDEGRRVIAERKLELMVLAGLAESQESARKVIRQVALQLSMAKLREASGRSDLQVIQAIQAVDELDREANLLSARLMEWYGLHFPELFSLVRDGETYARLVASIGSRSYYDEGTLASFGFSKKKVEAFIIAAKETKGGPVGEEELTTIRTLAEHILASYRLKERLSQQVEASMKSLAPNLSSLAGPTIGARLIAKAGGLERLARMPASTIQVLGAERALFRAIRTGSRPPKHGLIFQHQSVHSSPKWQRGKVARSLAAKLAIAARVDAYGGGRQINVGEKFQSRLAEIREKYKQPKGKVRAVGKGRPGKGS